MPELALIIGNKNYSSWSLRPWILLKHFGLSFKEIRIALFTDTTQQALEPYHSNFKVPVLQDGDLTVWDSLSILEYLSERYLEDRAWPQDQQARAIARSISAEMHSSFADLRRELPMNCRRQFDNIRLSAAAIDDIERVTSLWRLCRTQYGGSGPWLFGEFSIADAMYIPVALRFHGYNVLTGDIEQAYIRTVLDHPAIVEWIEAGKQEKEIIKEDEIEP